MTDPDHQNRMRPVDTGERAAPHERSGISPPVLLSGLLVLTVVVVTLVLGTVPDRTSTAASPPAATTGQAR